MSRFTALFITILLAASGGLAQSLQNSQTEQQIVEGAADQWWFATILLLICGLGLAIFFWKKSKNNNLPTEIENRYTDYYSDAYDDSVDVDVDKEMEWLRRVKKPNAKIPKIQTELKTDSQKKAEPKKIDIDTQDFQEKMRKLQFSRLPINSFTQLANAKGFVPLPISDDPSLLDAIDQANDESEEDEAVREVALRVLAAFKTQNSVESVGQIALYDVSSVLRSKAVSILADFDHESVFEIMILACADPTREVRAAAARGLFRLSFDRAHAWKRIIESDDEYRITQASRAAIEAGIVERSFDRLAHDDLKVAYEAFALCSMLIKAGETKEIFETLKNHNDLRVKFALLHILGVQKDHRLLPELYKFVRLKSVSPEVKQRANEAISANQEVTVCTK
jgi:hypothetical protein